MDEIPTPRIAVDHPDRHLTCQEAMEAAFLQLIDRAVISGWSERETTAALGDLVDNHMLSIIANGETDAALAMFRKMGP